MPISVGDMRSWDDSSIGGVDFKNDTTSIDSSEASRRESVVSRSFSEWNWNDLRNDVDRISPSSGSANSTNTFRVSYPIY